MTAAALAAAIVVASPLFGSSPEAVGPPVNDSVEAGEDDGTAAVGEDATSTGRVWECAESETLSIPLTDIEINEFTIADEEALRESQRDAIASLFTFAPNSPRLPALDANLVRLEQVADGRDYDLTIVDDAVANAFIVPGGSIFITTGLLDVMNDDQVTAILAHEVAHGVCRHLAKQIERETLALAGLDAVLGESIDIDGLTEAALSEVIGAAGIIAFSKEDEAEADLVSLDIADAAGFEPLNLVSAFEVFLELEGGAELDSVERFLSTHPPTQDRIDAINQALE